MLKIRVGQVFEKFIYKLITKFVNLGYLSASRAKTQSYYIKKLRHKIK